MARRKRGERRPSGVIEYDPQNPIPEPRTVTVRETVVRRAAPRLQPATRRVTKAREQVQRATPAVNQPGQFVTRANALPSVAATTPEASLKKPPPAKAKPPTLGELSRARPLDQRQCKSRPRNNKGNGNSRPFVKWCK